MAEMYFKLVKAGKRQMTATGPLPQVPDQYLVEVKAMLDKESVA